MPSNPGFLSDTNIDTRMLIEGGVATLANGSTFLNGGIGRVDIDGDSISSSDDDSTGHCHWSAEDLHQNQSEVRFYVVLFAFFLLRLRASVEFVRNSGKRCAS
ncbi:hypothetical protein Y032_0203g1813 [Ancylostoma ceylanicum]|uniref:Uncharacterized protein n=1 Tax=Ancylostoma ceylanicum TaxID=53326 RepID=A0A016SMQ1_9BILA|nr:hypothetical protein Y032_0203g1813 [Ancylostoma ceylanicum]